MTKLRPILGLSLLILSMSACSSRNADNEEESAQQIANRAAAISAAADVAVNQQIADIEAAANAADAATNSQ